MDMSYMTRRGMLILFGTAVITLLAAAVVGACTLTVGPTAVVEDPTQGPNGEFQAVGAVSYALENQSACDEDNDQARADQECEDLDDNGSAYDFGISVGARDMRSTCHYGNEHSDTDPGPGNEFDMYTQASQKDTPDGANAVLKARVEDNQESPGVGYACFTSEEQNNADDGGATATSPQPVVVGP
jgi:hypothetical protein